MFYKSNTKQKFSEMQGSKISTEIFSFLSNNWYEKFEFLEKSAQKLTWSIFYLQRLGEKEKVSYRF